MRDTAPSHTLGRSCAWIGISWQCRPPARMSPPSSANRCIICAWQVDGLTPEQRSRRARRNGTLAMLRSPAPLLPKPCAPVDLAQLREQADAAAAPGVSAAVVAPKKDYSKWLGNSGPRRQGSAVRFFDAREKTQAWHTLLALDAPASPLNRMWISEAGLEKASFGGGMAADRSIRRHSHEAQFGTAAKRPRMSKSAKHRVDFEVRLVGLALDRRPPPRNLIPSLQGNPQ